jgi:CheY-like chemotaxis protein
VAHDFNNLLTIIGGHAELLARELPPGDSHQADVDAIRGAARRAASFTEQLLTISRRRVGQEAVIDLPAALTDFEPVLRRLVPDLVTFVTEIDPAAGRVRIDLSQLEQLVLNLVVNACQAMRDGGTLTVRAARSADGRSVVLTTRDTGCGMDTATRERCFEPFFTTRTSSGTGLGLATVYGIVVRAGGEITVESALGEGSTFEVALPWCDEVVSRRRGDDDTSGPVQGSGVVLLVEHELDVLGLMDKALRQAGYEVVAAASPGEALMLADGVGHVDVLVTDVLMPVMTGTELATALTYRRPGLPVLFVSGYMDDDQREQVVRRQPRSRFLPKPFTMGQLASAVHDTIALTTPVMAEPDR